VSSELGASFGKHLDQLLFPVQQVVRNELHGSAGRGVIETYNDSFRRFIEARTGGQLFGWLAFEFEHRGSFGDKPDYRARMLVPAGPLRGSERDLAHIDRSNGPCPESDIQKRLANDCASFHSRFDAQGALPVAGFRVPVSDRTAGAFAWNVDSFLRNL